MKEYEKIGEAKFIDGDWWFCPGWSDNGCVFKDEEAYEKDWDAPCYVPEYAFDEARSTLKDGYFLTSAYTHNQLLELCNGNREMCNCLFASLNWCYPETKLNDWEMHDEISEFYEFIKVGAKVWWHDPDNDLSSGEYEVYNIEDEDNLDDTIVLIGNGYSEVEALSYELTPVYDNLKQRADATENETDA